MKFIKAIFLSIVFISLFSCKEDKGMLPLQPLEGTWEYAFYNPDQEFFFIYQYIFNPDGTFEKSILIRESESTKVLGYYSYSTGAYELRGQAYSEFVERSYVLALDAYLFYVPKENLIEVEIDGSPQQTGTLTFTQNNRSFELGYPCNDTPSGSSANCIGALTYRRVD
jgi:hypothetical protein